MLYENNQTIEQKYYQIKCETKHKGYFDYYDYDLLVQLDIDSVVMYFM